MPHRDVARCDELSEAHPALLIVEPFERLAESLFDPIAMKRPAELQERPERGNPLLLRERAHENIAPGFVVAEKNRDGRWHVTRGRREPRRRHASRQVARDLRKNVLARAEKGHCRLEGATSACRQLLERDLIQETFLK